MYDARVHNEKEQTIYCIMQYLPRSCQTRRDVAKALPTWWGKTIVDVTNAYHVLEDQLTPAVSARLHKQSTFGKAAEFDRRETEIFRKRSNLRRRVVIVARQEHDSPATVYGRILVKDGGDQWLKPLTSLAPVKARATALEEGCPPSSSGDTPHELTHSRSSATLALSGREPNCDRLKRRRSKADEDVRLAIPDTASAHFRSIS